MLCDRYLLWSSVIKHADIVKKEDTALVEFNYQAFKELRNSILRNNVQLAISLNRNIVFIFFPTELANLSVPFPAHIKIQMQNYKPQRNPQPRLYESQPNHIHHRQLTRRNPINNVDQEARQELNPKINLYQFLGRSRYHIRKSLHVIGRRFVSVARQIVIGPA